ncbi:MAG: bifunctional folylpolyglutamate synthase/dihydrofolate synthase [Eubacterium sp.]|nr:bifunctional folylpolyglutamate synthase/dihydrofolate synthase [Eubacterium sp.]
MNYTEARRYLKEVNKYGSVLGLESITTLLDALGNPQKELKVVHIAGTNGKGSTLAFIQSVLVEAGYQIGRYSSPAVFDYDEIIQINGKNIEKEELADIVTLIREKADIILEKYGFHPTTFEIETAMAFEYFKRMKCDIVLVECGMGGAGDATNVFEQVLCCVITSISLDHTAFLGETIEEIAQVKAGIIKQYCPVVMAKQSEKTVNCIKNTAKEKNAEFIQAGQAQLTVQNNVPDEIRVKNQMIYRALNGKKYQTNIQMLGTYQSINAATAIETLLCLENYGYQLEEYIEQGLLKAMWNGRMEIISEDPLFIIDGAHNPGAVKELRNSMDLYFTNRRITFIMGVLADKDFAQEAELIADRAENIITVTPDNSRALDGKKLAETLSVYHKNVQYMDNIRKAVTAAMDFVRKGQTDMILAFGSLSHLKDIKQAVKAERRD